MKILNFADKLAPLVLSGAKTSTWRLFDDKNLAVGDELIFKNKATAAEFAQARIVNIKEKKLGQITEADFVGHERFETMDKMYEEYREYYGDQVGPDTMVKMIDFEIIKKRVGAGVGVMLYRGGKILLGLRASDPAKARSSLRGEGTWTMPGGKLEFSETIEEGARRETLEETGIILNEVKVMCVNTEKNEHAHYITVGAYCDNFSGEAELKEKVEFVRWEWFDLNNLPSPIFPSSAHMVENYKQNKFYIGRA